MYERTSSFVTGTDVSVMRFVSINESFSSAYIRQSFDKINSESL